MSHTRQFSRELITISPPRHKQTMKELNKQSDNQQNLQSNTLFQSPSTPTNQSNSQSSPRSTPLKDRTPIKFHMCVAPKRTFHQQTISETSHLRSNISGSSSLPAENSHQQLNADADDIVIQSLDQLIDQPSDFTTIQTIDQSNNEHIEQPSGLPLEHPAPSNLDVILPISSVDQFILPIIHDEEASQMINLSENETVNHSNSQLINQSIDQLDSQSLIQSPNKSISQPNEQFCTVSNLTECVQMIACRLIDQSNNQSSHQKKSINQASINLSTMTSQLSADQSVNLINLLYALMNQQSITQSINQSLQDKVINQSINQTKLEEELSTSQATVVSMDRKLWELESLNQKLQHDLSANEANNQSMKKQLQQTIKQSANQTKQFETKIKKQKQEIDCLTDRLTKLLDRSYSWFANHCVFYQSNNLASKPVNEQSLNQTAKQPIKQSTVKLTKPTHNEKGQPISRFLSQTSSLSASQSINQSKTHVRKPSLNQSINLSSSQATSQSVQVTLIDKSELAVENRELRSILQSVMQSIDQSINPTTEQSINQSTASQSIAQSNDQWLSIFPLSMIRTTIDSEIQKRVQLITESINQSIKQSNIPSNTEPITQSTNQSISRSMNDLTLFDLEGESSSNDQVVRQSSTVSDPHVPNRAIAQSTPQPTNQSNIQTVNQSTSQSSTQSIDQTNNQSVSQLTSHESLLAELEEYKLMLDEANRFIDQTINHSINQTVSQTINQSSNRLVLSPSDRRLSLEYDLMEREQQLISQSANLSINQSMLQLEREKLMEEKAKFNQSVNQSIHRSVFATPVTYRRTKSNDHSITATQTRSINPLSIDIPSFNQSHNPSSKQSSDQLNTLDLIDLIDCSFDGLVTPSPQHRRSNQPNDQYTANATKMLESINQSNNQSNKHRSWCSSDFENSSHRAN